MPPVFTLVNDRFKGNNLIFVNVISLETFFFVVWEGMISCVSNCFIFSIVLEIFLK